MSTFTETAATPQEMRDKICEWIESKANAARNRATDLHVKRFDLLTYQVEARIYAEISRFWRSVLINPDSE